MGGPPPAGPASDGAVAWESPVPGALWLRTWRLGEWVEGPLSPLFETFLLPVLSAAREGGGSGRFGWHMPRMFRMRAPSYCVLHGHYFARAEPDRLSVALLPARFLSSELRGGWLDRFRALSLPRYEERLFACSAVEAGDAGDASELLSSLDELALDSGELWYALGLASGGAIPIQRFLTRASDGAVSEADVLTLFGGFDSPATAEQQSLWRLAQVLSGAPGGRGLLDEISIDEVLAAEDLVGPVAAFRAALAAHLRRFGHQVRSLDFYYPCLAEEPARLGAALRCYMEPGAKEPERSQAEAAARREELGRRALAGLSGGKRRLYEKLLGRAQGYARAREEIVFQLQRAWPLFRRGFLALGARLAAAGAIAAAEEVFFLTAGELRAAAAGPPRGSLAAAVEARRRSWREAAELEPPVSIPPGNHPVWHRATVWPIRLRFHGLLEQNGGRVLEGTAASPGRVRGRARVLGFASEAHRLAAGEVLVARATTPDWTPLFALAAAVVTDVGGTASHSSIVAREYGIPAVVGTREATRSIRDGELVTVDGSAGRVYLGSAPDEGQGR